MISMFNFQYIKFLPSEYVLRYKNGKVMSEGPGLSFLYFVPNTSVVVMPISSEDVPFIFEELTKDYQSVTIQGEITYKIKDYKKVAKILDYSINLKKKTYLKEDYKKIPQRLINITKVLVKKEIENMPLREAIQSSEELATQIRRNITDSEEITNLGIEIMNFSILAVKPNKETARALEAQAREEILRKADEAIYERRNASIEQERIVKENELNTEIAIEEKKQQIEEAKLEAKRSVMEKENKMQDEELGYKTQLEEKRKEFVALEIENAKAESDAKAYQLEAIMNVIKEVNPTVLQALTNMEMQPDRLIATAFQQLATNADKIGQLNVTPDLLETLMKR